MHKAIEEVASDEVEEGLALLCVGDVRGVFKDFETSCIYGRELGERAT